MNSTFLLQLNPLSRLLSLITFALLSGFLFAFFGISIVKLIWGINVFDNPEALNDLTNPTIIAANKVILVCQHIGMFILPALIFASSIGTQYKPWLFLNKKPNTNQLFFTFLLFLASMPLLNSIVELNQNMVFPSFLSDFETMLKMQEELMTERTVAFIEMPNIGSLVINLLVIAILPAIGEELIFRGGIQRFAIQWIKNKHTAIWFTAFLFSLMHMQFYGFVPRMLMGALFGYVLVYTGNIWLPILLHFLNNAAAIIGNYLLQHNYITDTGETFNGSLLEWCILLISIGLTPFIIYRIKKQNAPNLSVTDFFKNEKTLTPAAE